jgi:hypothetical protein
MGAARDAAPEGEKRAIHGIVSPPEESVTTIEEFYNMIGDAYDLAKQKGVRGGAAVPHGYRIKEEIQKLARVRRDEGEFQGGDWKFVLEEVDRHWRDCVYWSPHVHIIGWVGSNDVGKSDPQNDNGWIWKNQRSLSEFHLTREDGYDDMIGLAHYLMSHVTVQKGAGKQAYRWFGELAPASFSPEDNLSEGRLNALQRRAESVAGCVIEEKGGEGGGGEEREECPKEGCDGELITIWEAEAFLDQNGDELSQDEYDRLVSADLWRRGDIEPPPGLKRPQNEQQANESFRALTEGVGALE